MGGYFFMLHRNRKRPAGDRGSAIRTCQWPHCCAILRHRMRQASPGDVRSRKVQMKFRARLGLALSGLAIVLSLATAAAQDYPGSRPIRIIVPYGPGASTDLLARATADITAKKYGYSFVIESRPGAGTLLGTRAVKNADPDGYTILFQATNFLNNLHTLKEPGYRIEDFTVVGLLGQTSYVLIIPSALPARNLQEFVAYARSRNGALNFASLGHGTRQQLLAEHLKVDGKFDWKEIPYKGGMEGVQAVIGGQVSGYFVTVSLAQAQAQSPGIREIGIASEERSPFVPDVPTFKEQGFPGISDKSWFVLFVRSDTQKHVIDKLRSVFTDVVATPEFADALKKIAIEPLTTTYDKFTDDMQTTSEKLAKEQIEFKIEKQ
jgi:tripartite-type tricarboxylate transporter receptor subunit TctC